MIAIFSKARKNRLVPEQIHDSNPAGQRIRVIYPAGFVTAGGEVVKTHKQEVIPPARSQEAEARGRHPLNRISRMADCVERLVVSTPDIHSPKRIGRAGQCAHKGQLNLNDDKQGCFVRVNRTSPAKSMENKSTRIKKRR